jgi:hypothetical protein
MKSRAYTSRSHAAREQLPALFLPRVDAIAHTRGRKCMLPQKGKDPKMKSLQANALQHIISSWGRAGARPCCKLLLL